MEIKYRSAEESDLDAICSLIGRAIESMEKNKIFQWDNVYPSREVFAEDISNGELFVGTLDGGIAVLYVINRECDDEYGKCRWKYLDCEYRIIHRLCVDPKYQKMGIAKNTLKHIEAELKSSGVEAIRLDVFSDNPSALALYLNSGYEKAGSAEWRMGRFFLMEKCL
ncbi:MAG: GNAT family N-acetyltransferase [Oscillospiraceae bacterium]|nr:GNAT family N-acetyltransferase [Oscillospiraceae bacterium]